MAVLLVGNTIPVGASALFMGGLPANRLVPHRDPSRASPLLQGSKLHILHAVFPTPARETTHIRNVVGLVHNGLT
jgi:hypothetical protein